MSKDNPNDGRFVKALFWPGIDGVCTPGSKYATDELTIKLRNEFHGDHSEDWFCVYKDGKEVERHNARFVETVQWLESASPQSAPTGGSK